ncbi:hypothetical protein BDD12DRAFT_842515 [Trichophaea hybrida]|nr:hypothetical protein BDD12DRAFT_842515 [Trichophaea hybrida]
MHTLTSLPVEIITKVFQELHGFASAVSLASCSQHLHCIFRANKRHIWPRVFRNDPLVNGPTLTFYPTALALHRAQHPNAEADPLEAVAAMVRTACIVSRTAFEILTSIHPTNRLGYEATDRAAFTRYGNEFLRSALYDAWLLLTRGEELAQIFRKGIPQPLHLQRNRLVTQAFCVYLSEPRWREYGYPDLEMVLPVAERGLGSTPLIFGFSVGTPEEQLRDALLLACNIRDRSLKEAALQAKMLAKPIELPDKETKEGTCATIQQLRKRVADLEASEKEMKEEIKNMKRMLEERFGQMNSMKW